MKGQEVEKVKEVMSIWKAIRAKRVKLAKKVGQQKAVTIQNLISAGTTPISASSTFIEIYSSQLTYIHTYIKIQ